MGEPIVTVMGMDIKPGHSPRSSRTPKYAVVILRDGVVIRELDDVPLHSVIRLIIEYHVDILAVDNIYELVGGQRDLVKLSQIIPSWCRIVEVTNTTSGYYSVQHIAKELKLDSDSLTPIHAAFVIAYAAYTGYGREVKPASDRVYILVSKGRTPNQGGSSSERFKRSIRASILRLVKEIKETLDQNNLEYDLTVKRSDGGLERGLFIVYAPMEKIRGIVGPLNYKNAKISIKPALPKRVAEKGRKLVILGIDPGTSIGVAVIDLNGVPLLVESYKNPDREQLIENVLSKGKPIIVSVDTSKSPEYAKKIATILGSVLYTPSEDLSVEEKQRIALDINRIYNVEIVDSHARDALASAVKAYKQIKPIIDEVESKLRGLRGVDRDEIVAHIVRGRPLSEVLEEVFIKALSRGKNAREDVDTEKNKRFIHEDVAKLHARISELEGTVKRLEQELSYREEVLKNLELEIKMLKKKAINDECERKINHLNIEVEYLSRMVEEKNKLLALLKDRVLALENAILDISRGMLTLACKPPPTQECRGLPLYLDNPGDLWNYIEYLKSTKTGALVPSGTSEVNWKKARVPVVEASKKLDLDNFVLVDVSVLNEIKKQWKYISELEISEKRDRIIKTIKDYQEARKTLNRVNRE